MLKRPGLFAPLLTSLVIGLFAFPRPAQACSCVTPGPTPAALCRRTQYFGERQPARPIWADGGGTNYGGGCLARALVFWFAAIPRPVHRRFCSWLPFLPHPLSLSFFGLRLCRARFIGGFVHASHASPALFPYRSIEAAPLWLDAERYRLTEGHCGSWRRRPERLTCRLKSPPLPCSDPGRRRSWL